MVFFANSGLFGLNFINVILKLRNTLDVFRVHTDDVPDIAYENPAYTCYYSCKHGVEIDRNPENRKQTF